jgi:hypothetical protein
MLEAWWFRTTEVGHTGAGADRMEGKVREMREYTRARREPAQAVTLVVAGLFVLAAVLDTVPGALDNAVHLAFGLVGFALSRGPRSARAFLIGGGVTYFLFWQFGSVIDPTLVPFHTTNAAVHLSLVASMIGLAVLSGGDRAPAPAIEYVWDAPDVDGMDLARHRQPPGRDDRRTTRMAAAGRRPVALAYRS